MPYISPDKKKMATIYPDPYDNDSELAVFKIVAGKLINNIYVRFKYWMPGDEKMIFWAADGKLYLPVQWSDKYWTADGWTNTDYLYIQISLL
jgi:hypothetical protein